MVNNGVSALSTPAMALGMCVCARVNMKGGIPLPKIATTVIYFQSASLRLFNEMRSQKNDNAAKANAMRQLATCVCENPLSPCFIKIKELPHSSANKMINDQCHAVGWPSLVMDLSGILATDESNGSTFDLGMWGCDKLVPERILKLLQPLFCMRGYKYHVYLAGQGWLQ